MPRKLARQQAIDEIAAARAQVPTGRDEPCLMCEILQGQLQTGARVLSQDDLLAFLPRYGVRWGHVVIAPKSHLTSASEAGSEVWRRMGDLAWLAQSALMRVLSPLRCYVATLGSDGEQPMTSAHLHTHVIPVHRAEDRPGQVLTWRHGVVTAEPAEFEALAAEIRRGMADLELD